MSDEGGGGGSPAWVMTFADLMSLLMCFFVLLLSFAEMDVQKFKQLAGSMEFAFGVQRQVEAMEIPKGTSFVAQEFSAGKPEDTVDPEVKQKTTEIEKIQLETDDAVVEEAKKDSEVIKKELAEEIKEGKIEVEAKGSRIVIRIMEQGSFPSGSAVFHEDFLDVMAKISKVLSKVDGKLTVAGHTDNVPIKTEKFRSNWELSSARAVSVTHALLDEGDLEQSRFVIIGHADTKPRVANDTPKNKAMNRRVEIIVEKKDPPQEASAEDLKNIEKGNQGKVEIEGVDGTEENSVPIEEGKTTESTAPADEGTPTEGAPAEGVAPVEGSAGAQESAPAEGVAPAEGDAGAKDALNTEGTTPPATDGEPISSDQIPEDSPSPEAIGPN